MSVSSTSTAVASLGVVAALLGACASESGSAASASVRQTLAVATPTGPDPVTPTSAAPPSASASPVAAVDCQGLETTTAAITSVVHDVGAAVGTTKDPSAIMTGLPDLQLAMAKTVPPCSPDAEASMWLVDAALTRLLEQYQAGSERPSIAADRALLLTTRIAGVEFFKKLGADPAPWQAVPRRARMGCTDLKTLGPALSTAVLELSHLVGSTNEAASYLTTVEGESSVMTDLAPTCDPSSKKAAAAFDGAVQKLMTDFTSGTDPAVVDADKTALNNVRAAGLALYKVLGLNSAGWANVPPEAQ